MLKYNLYRGFLKEQFDMVTLAYYSNNHFNIWIKNNRLSAVPMAIVKQHGNRAPAAKPDKSTLGLDTF